MSNNNIVDDPAFGIDFNSKYDGLQVEELLDKMAGLSIDEALSDTSENPVQNMAVTKAVKSKQDAIEDLEVIRRGAARGATALQDIPSDYPKKTDFKTINNQSILGTGNIVIETGSKITVDAELSEDSTNPVQNKVITGRFKGLSDDILTLQGSIANKMALLVISQPSGTIETAAVDTAYIIDSAAETVQISAFEEPAEGVLIARYMAMFTGVSTLNLPAGVLWADGTVPVLDPSSHYELSIVGMRFAGSMVYKAILASFKAA